MLLRYVALPIKLFCFSAEVARDFSCLCLVSFFKEEIWLVVSGLCTLIAGVADTNQDAHDRALLYSR